MHDPSLKRTTGVDRRSGRPHARAELPKEVPTFEEAIACLPGWGWGCNVEIAVRGREAETARVAVATLRRCWPASLPPPLLSSFKGRRWRGQGSGT